MVVLEARVDALEQRVTHLEPLKEGFRQMREEWKDVQVTRLAQMRVLNSLRETQIEHGTAIGDIQGTLKEHSTAIGDIQGTLKEHSTAIGELRETQLEHGRLLHEVGLGLAGVV